MRTRPAGLRRLSALTAADVRVAWMDARAPGGSLWNVCLRTSTDGGATWSAESDISSPATDYSCILPDGFEFPFGDHSEIAIDGAGASHAVFGEGLNDDTPGSIWFTHGS